MKNIFNSFYPLWLVQILSLVITQSFGQKVEAKNGWDLQQCIDYALSHNFEIRDQIEEIKLKNFDVEIAKRQRLPLIKGYTNLYSNFGYSQDVFGTILRNDNLNSNMGITAEIMLYNFGALRNQIRSNQLGLDLEVLDKETLDRQLTVQVVEGYLALLLQQALTDARDSAVVFSNKLYERAKATMEIGTTSRSEMFEAKANLAREHQKLELEKVELDRLRLRLSHILQINLEDSISIVNDALLKKDMEWDLPKIGDLIEMSYMQHPVIRKNDLWIKDVKIQKELITSELYPVITGSTALGTTYFNAFNNRLSQRFLLQSRNNFAQQVAITIAVPIFNRGITRAKIKKMDVFSNQVLVRSQKEELQIRQQVERIYIDFETNKRNLVRAEEAKALTKIALDFAEMSYEAGQISIYELNTSRQNFVAAENELLRSKYSALYSYKMLQYQVSGTYMKFNDLMENIN